jgi:hypothetical protein
MEKIHQFVGLKFGEDVANELKNRAKVVLPPPEYSAVAKARHVVYERMIRTQQSTLLTAMQAQLKVLEDAAAAAATAAAAAATAALSSTISGNGGVSGASSIVPVLDDEALLKIAWLKNEIAEIEYESMQDFPYKLNGEEATLYSNEMKSHSLRVATPAPPRPARPSPRPRPPSLPRAITALLEYRRRRYHSWQSLRISSISDKLLPGTS